MLCPYPADPMPTPGGGEPYSLHEKPAPLPGEYGSPDPMPRCATGERYCPTADAPVPQRPQPLGSPGDAWWQWPEIKCNTFHGLPLCLCGTLCTCRGRLSRDESSPACMSTA